MKARAALAAAALLLGAGCGGGDDDRAAATSTSSSTAGRPLPLYDLAATRRCLTEKGAAVRRLAADTGRLRALRDLAQRTSYEVRVGGARIGFALAASAADARLLEMLLRAPGDAYRLERRRNAVLMYRSLDRRQGAVVRGCLSPSG